MKKDSPMRAPAEFELAKLLLLKPWTKIPSIRKASRSATGSFAPIPPPAWNCEALLPPLSTNRIPAIGWKNGCVRVRSGVKW